MDKSKENTRVADLMKLNDADLLTKIAMGLENPSIYKINTTGDVDLTKSGAFTLAVAAKLIDWDDLEWIKAQTIFEGIIPYSDEQVFETTEIEEIIKSTIPYNSSEPIIPLEIEYDNNVMHTNWYYDSGFGQNFKAYKINLDLDNEIKLLYIYPQNNFDGGSFRFKANDNDILASEPHSLKIK